VKIARGFALLLLLASAGLLVGCFALPMEGSYIQPATFDLPDFPAWRTSEVRRGNVEVFSTLTARHDPALEERLFFPVAGVLITGVYVSVRDEVREGDIIASLDRSGVADDLERMQREEQRMRLRIAQLDERHAHTLWMAEMSGVPVDDSFYINQRRDLVEDLGRLRLELEYLQRQYESRLVRATKDGTISSAIIFTERTTSGTTDPVAIIADQHITFFVVTASEARYLRPGDQFELSMTGTYFPVEVIDPEEWGIERPEVAWDEALLVLIDGGLFMPRAIGHIRAVFEAVYDVLYLPNVAIHRVDDREFVYVLEENGLRRIRDVQTGLVGSTHTEVISGLVEGEVVVR